MATTTFFTACDAPYWPFVVPYAVAVLHHNADAAVEICVEDPARYRSVYADALAVVARHFPDRFLLREGAFEGVVPGAVRFLEAPRLRSEYTYIGDVDILVVDGDVTATHLAHMAKTGLPYSNRLRPGQLRLTGLHFTRTDAHYPLVVPPDANIQGNDEELLYRLIVAKGLPLPAPEHTFRPLHGIHFSIRRPLTPTPEAWPHWALPQDAVDRYLALWKVPAWREASAHFHPAYQAMLLVLEAALQTRHPDRLVYRRREAEALWQRLAIRGVAPTIVEDSRPAIDELLGDRAPQVTPGRARDGRDSGEPVKGPAGLRTARPFTPGRPPSAMLNSDGSIDAVLPLVARDLERFEKLLLPSVRHFFAPLGTCWVVVPPADDQSVRERIGDPRFRVISEADVVPEVRLLHRERAACEGERPDRISGWFVQQLIKLSIARVVSSPFYLTLDADVVCVRKVGYGDLVRDGRGIVNVSDVHPQANPRAPHAQWYEWAEKLLGFAGSGRTHGVTPAVLNSEAAHRLLSFLEERLGPDAARAESYLLRHLPWTEYTLYYTYLEHAGLFDAYHFPALVNTYGNNIWRRNDPAAWDPARGFSAGHGFYFSVLQSNNPALSVDAIVAKIRSYFRAIGEPSPF